MDKQGHKIGLLGGSFNPAHAGHLEISLTALERLSLDYVWWMISPQNPLKNNDQMDSYEHRKTSAINMANDPRIIVTDIERELQTTYTVDTVLKLTRSQPDDQFIWLMGADNLAQFHLWKDWQAIADTVPIAIFSRPSYSKPSLTGVAAIKLAKFRIEENKAHQLYNIKPPAWVYFSENENPSSSTEIRQKNNFYKRLQT